MRQTKRDCRFPDSPLAVTLTPVRDYFVFFVKSNKTIIGNNITNKII